MVNAERYITPELKEYEAKILGAEEKITQLEQELFAELVSYLVDYIQPVQTNAQLIAQIDVLSSLPKMLYRIRMCDHKWTIQPILK